MDAVVGNIITGIVVAGLGLLGTWLLTRVQKKAASTQEQFGVTDKWKEWAEKLEERVEKAEERAERAEKSADESSAEVTRLHKRVAELEPLVELFNLAIRHIRELRAFIIALGAHEQIPRLPHRLADVADLFEPREDPK